MNELINLAVDYYMQDREEILTGTRLTTLQPEVDYFRGSYIRDFHNICRRKYQKSIRRDISEPIVPRQQVNLAIARDAEEALPEAWYKGLGNAPPYQVDFESNDPTPLPQLSKEGARVKHLALVLQSKIAQIEGSISFMPLAKAREIVHREMMQNRKKKAISYKVEEVFSPEARLTMPLGIRHGPLESEDML